VILVISRLTSVLDHGGCPWARLTYGVPTVYKAFNMSIDPEVTHVIEPRLAPVEYDDLDDAGRARYQTIAASRGGMPTSFRVFMNSGGATDAIAALGDYVRFQTSFDPRTLELAIMRVATVLEDRYMWAHHAVLAAEAGLTPADLTALAEPADRGWTGRDEDAALAEFIDRELTGTMTDPVFDRLRDRLGPARTVDFVLLISYYALIHQLFATFRIDSPTDTREPAPGSTR
jgi:4-carboxymuconolactone decarboxylase